MKKSITGENTTAEKLVQSQIKQRLERKYDPAINPDMGTDARKPLLQPEERIRKIKPSTAIADGQYTRENSRYTKTKMVLYPYLPNQVFRRCLKTGVEVPIFQKIDGEWYLCEGIMPSQNEVVQLRAFAGTIGMDIDAACSRKRKVKSTPKGTYNTGGKCVYRCKGTVDPEQEKKRRKQQKKAAKKQRSLLAVVQIENVRRK